MADKSAAITFAHTVTPSQQPSEACANDGANEPVAILVTFDHSRRFIFTKKTMGRDEMLPPYCYFFVGLRLNVAKPVRIIPNPFATMSSGPSFRYSTTFQHGLPPETSPTSCMSQQQEAFSKEPFQMPAVTVDGSTKQVPQHSVFSDRNHSESLPTSIISCSDTLSTTH